MDEYQPIFGREAELALIDELVYAWGERYFVTIAAPSGAGKTHLLTALRQRYQRGSYSRLPLLVTAILNLNTPHLHSPHNVGIQLARHINSSAFEPYLALFGNGNRTALALPTPTHTALARVRSQEVLQQTFQDCLSVVSANKRLIILIDSLDVLPPALVTTLWAFCQRFENTLVICAGQPSAAVQQWQQLLPPPEARSVTFTPLAEAARAAYLHYALEQQQRSLSVDVLRQLLWLSSDSPVLMNLAVRYAHAAPLADWLKQSRRRTTQASYSPTDYDEFARQVVATIIAPDTLASRLLRVLAEVAPLDLHMAAAVLNVPETALAEAFTLIQQHPAVRAFADNWIGLHEHVARVIRTELLPEYDPHGTQTKLMYERVANALNLRADKLAHHLLQVQQLATPQQGLLTAGDSCPTLSPEAHRLLHDEYWWLRLRQLAYTLAASHEAGMHLFQMLFTEATQGYSLTVRGELFAVLEPYRAQLDGPDHVLYNSAWIQHLEETGQYQQVRQQANLMLAEESLLPTAQVVTLIHLGHADVRLGFLDQAVANFERAIRLCRIHDLRIELVQALAGRAWAYRHQGRHTEALNDYLEAYQRSLNSQYWEQTAWVLIGISYINMQNADRQGAYESNRSALELAHRYQFRKVLGAAYANLGEIQVRFNEPTAALESFARALQIFEEQNDYHWIAIVRCGTAFAYQILQRFAEAHAELAWAGKYGAVSLRTRILYSQALVAWDQGQLEQARDFLLLCREMSREIGDQFHDYKSFADLIELAWEFGESELWKPFAQELDEAYAWRKGAEAMRLYGSCLRKIGDLAICAGEYDAALAAYEEGFPLIAEHEIHERYTIRSQMRQTNERILHCIPSKILSRLGRGLAVFWRSNSTLIAKYPEALLTFYLWEQAEHDTVLEVGAVSPPLGE
ncbi:MAG: ATP-binding protein [Chloroflexaceae bacterium]|nr:ATP-binding protein [Chloroflexaceae bacterium]